MANNETRNGVKAKGKPKSPSLPREGFGVGNAVLFRQRWFATAPD
jgi:hypothetical protein